MWSQWCSAKRRPPHNYLEGPRDAPDQPVSSTFGNARFRLVGPSAGTSQVYDTSDITEFGAIL